MCEAQNGLEQAELGGRGTPRPPPWVPESLRQNPPRPLSQERNSTILPPTLPPNKAAGGGDGSSQEKQQPRPPSSPLLSSWGWGSQPLPPSHTHFLSHSPPPSTSPSAESGPSAGEGNCKSGQGPAADPTAPRRPPPPAPPRPALPRLHPSPLSRLWAHGEKKGPWQTAWTQTRCEGGAGVEVRGAPSHGVHRGDHGHGDSGDGGALPCQLLQAEGVALDSFLFSHFLEVD